jgi:hypothetical protein
MRRNNASEAASRQTVAEVFQPCAPSHFLLLNKARSVRATDGMAAACVGISATTASVIPQARERPQLGGAEAAISIGCLGAQGIR